MTIINKNERQLSIGFQGSERCNVSKEGFFDEVPFELVFEGGVKIGHMKMQGKGAQENKGIKLPVRVAKDT